MLPGRDVCYDEAAKMVSGECPVEEMNAEVFILYVGLDRRSRKDVLHATGGYLVFTAMTHRTSSTTMTATSTGAPPT